MPKLLVCAVLEFLHFGLFLEMGSIFDNICTKYISCLPKELLFYRGSGL